MTNERIIQNDYIAAQTTSPVYAEHLFYACEDEISLHGHEFLEIGITLNGIARHLVNQKEVSLYQKSVYVIPIGISHQINQMKNWDVCNIYLLPTMFSTHFPNMDFSTYYKLQNFLMRYYHNHSEALQFTLKEETFRAIKSMCDALKYTLFSDVTSFYVYQNHCIVNMLLLLAEDFYAQFGNTTGYRDPRLIKINHFIYAHLDYPLKQLLTELSSEFSLNSQYINRIVKKSIGIPVSRYIIQCKIEKSIQLLHTTETSPTDIAYSLGFYDYSHFHKYFIQYVGMSPHKYKNQK